MKRITIIKRRYVDYDLGEIKKYVHHDSKLIKNRDKILKYLKILGMVIRHYRWELFGTFEGYSVITNGYKQLKYIEINSGKIFSCNEIFSKLSQIPEGKVLDEC